MRVISLIDNDAFYTQVEIARDPARLAGQPVVVIQYNPFGDLSTLPPEADRIRPDSNGSIIAVSYEARKYGVKRIMMAQEAKRLCPGLQIVQVPVAHGKADISIYRNAGAAVLNILSSCIKGAVCERASVDEAYVDCTAAAQQLLADARRRGAGSGGGDAVPHVPLPDTFEGVHVAGVEEGPDAVAAWWARPADEWTQSDALLAAGSVVIAAARAAVKAALGYTCSAGIAHSKILAKLGAGLHKPAQQTVVPAHAVAGLLAPLHLTKLQKLGGKFGQQVMAALNVATVGELAAVPLPRLEAALGVEDAQWLSRLAQGFDGEEVKPRMLPKTISCGKTFRQHNVLTGLTAVHSALLQLAQELQERVAADRQQHQRLPKLLTVSFDSAPVQDAAAAAAAGGAAAAAAAAGDGGAEGDTAAAAAGGGADNSSGSGPSHGRLTVQNWRAGATNISRSCALRHVRADAIAADAHSLVKKWARDRPAGFRIVTMFISASNFYTAPTGASTLARYLTAPAPAAAAAAAKAEPPPPQHTQQQLSLQVGGGGSSIAAGSLKRRADGTAASAGRHSKTARTQGQGQRDLRAFLAAAPAAPAANLERSSSGHMQDADIDSGGGVAADSIDSEDAAAAAAAAECLVIEESDDAVFVSESEREDDCVDDSALFVQQHPGSHAVDTSPPKPAAPAPAAGSAQHVAAAPTPAAGCGRPAAASPARSALSVLQVLGVPKLWHDSAPAAAALASPVAAQPASSSVAPSPCGGGGGGGGSGGGVGEAAQAVSSAAAAAAPPGQQVVLEAQLPQPEIGQPAAQQGGDGATAAVQQPGSSSALDAQPRQLSDVDPEVLAALPWDLQIEVQQQLRRAAAGGRGTARGGRQRGGGRGGGGRSSHNNNKRQQQQQQQQGSITSFFSAAKQL